MVSLNLCALILNEVNEISHVRDGSVEPPVVLLWVWVVGPVGRKRHLLHVSEVVGLCFDICDVVKDVVVKTSLYLH